jgi:hypothetical protein
MLATSAANSRGFIGSAVHLKSSTRPPKRAAGWNRAGELAAASTTLLELELELHVDAGELALVGAAGASTTLLELDVDAGASTTLLELDAGELALVGAAGEQRRDFTGAEEALLELALASIVDPPQNAGALASASIARGNLAAASVVKRHSNAGPGNGDETADARTIDTARATRRSRAAKRARSAGEMFVITAARDAGRCCFAWAFRPSRSAGPSANFGQLLPQRRQVKRTPRARVFTENARRTIAIAAASTPRSRSSSRSALLAVPPTSAGSTLARYRIGRFATPASV